MLVNDLKHVSAHPAVNGMFINLIFNIHPCLVCCAVLVFNPNLNSHFLNKII